ncbi:M23 family metallopeptidase [Arenibacter sp. 6A1]|uniref:M23 family metallopeptidase n=1 Tax=Arenibacter sp. 6A1 TaxID=2720391 RepID=UPI001F10CE01|nr:M23 family metallopeptidase [Arenibacter sp. 6A1]
MNLRKIMKETLIIILFFFTITHNGQGSLPEDRFGSPLDIPIILAGTFGELRSNHFHAGIDIKTQQRQGLAVYSIADGSVSRIKISHWGYGKALYITHPNGYTSVYAHLQKFSPAIEAYIKKIQYQKKSYEVEVFPDPSELMLQRGELIAYSGNTGGSSGPHLHFEIRSTATEMPINPMLYGFTVADARKPTLLKAYAYPLSKQAQVNQSNEKIAIRFTEQPDGSFLADKLTALGEIGFGVNTFDRQDKAINQNGVYSIKQIVNGKLYTDYNFETFSFSESRYINTLIDYAHFSTYRERIQKCFREPANQLSIYKTIYNDGKVDVREGLSYNVEIHINDLAGNLTKLIIPVEGKNEAILNFKPKDQTADYVIAKKPNNFDLGGAKVYFPANTFYEDFYIDLKKGKDSVTIHNNKVAAHQNFTITFDVSEYPQEARKQLFIGRLDENLTPSYASTYKRGTTFTTRTRNLGTYTLVKDSIPPTIRPKNFKNKQWLSNYNYLSLNIADDLSGIDSYSATLNGEWILMEYEPKTNTITYNFDDIILDKKECELNIEVIDNVGNTSTFKATFFRK